MLNNYTNLIELYMLKEVTVEMRKNWKKFKRKKFLEFMKFIEFILNNTRYFIIKIVYLDD